MSRTEQVSRWVDTDWDEKGRLMVHPFVALGCANIDLVWPDPVFRTCEGKQICHHVRMALHREVRALFEEIYYLRGNAVQTDPWAMARREDVDNHFHTQIKALVQMRLMFTASEGRMVDEEWIDLELLLHAGRREAALLLMNAQARTAMNRWATDREAW